MIESKKKPFLYYAIKRQTIRFQHFEQKIYFQSIEEKITILRKLNFINSILYVTQCLYGIIFLYFKSERI